MMSNKGSVQRNRDVKIVKGSKPFLKIRVKVFFDFWESFDVNEAQLELENPSDIQALLQRLCDSDKRRGKIFDSHGKLMKDIIILRNGRHITNSRGIQTELQDGDEVAIFRPVGGG